jgi:hypothetical protein
LPNASSHVCEYSRLPEAVCRMLLRSRLPAERRWPHSRDAVVPVADYHHGPGIRHQLWRAASK